jgi:hypothetical protein
MTKHGGAGARLTQQGGGRGGDVVLNFTSSKPDPVKSIWLSSTVA